MALRPRPEPRHAVDFPVHLSWQRRDGSVLRVPCQCVDLSASGAKVISRDHIDPRSTVLVHSERFGRMGMATVRYSIRTGMKYRVGLEFAVSFVLSDPVRRKVLESVLRPDPEPQLPPAA